MRKYIHPLCKEIARGILIPTCNNATLTRRPMTGRARSRIAGFPKSPSEAWSDREPRPQKPQLEPRPLRDLQRLLDRPRVDRSLGGVDGRAGPDLLLSLHLVGLVVRDHDPAILRVAIEEIDRAADDTDGRGFPFPRRQEDGELAGEEVVLELPQPLEERARDEDLQEGLGQGERAVELVPLDQRGEVGGEELALAPQLLAGIGGEVPLLQDPVDGPSGRHGGGAGPPRTAGAPRGGPRPPPPPPPPPGGRGPP